ncbi:MAG: GNAT family N-acetyltransferase [Nanoarchaeota archaeon]|nr:GNAT family N-acetyltransferase [Nanoarchaeota archaeon]
MKIRKAKIKDLKEIDEIYKEGILDEGRTKLSKKSKKEILSDLNKSKKYRLKGFRKAISSSKERVLVCEEDEKIIGFSGAALSDKKRGAEITLVYLRKEYRKKSFGGKMVRRLMEWLKKNKESEVNVTMDFVNEASINLHKKFGFKVVSIIMQKKLK